MADPRPLGSIELDVERGKVRELARAVRADENVVVPTFTVTAAHSTPPGRSANELIIEAAGFDPSRVLLGEMSWSFTRPIEIGDTLTGTVRYLRTESKTGASGRLRLAYGDVEWRDTTGAGVVTVRVCLVEPARGDEA